MTPAVVLGAGISGLAAAHRLRATGHQVIVLEASNRPGGILRTTEIGGCRFELGPNTVQRSPELVALCRDAGVEDKLITASSAARRRYLLKGGKLMAVPGSPPALITSPLFSAIGKLRLLREPLVGRGPGPRESLADFARRRLGREAVPMVDAVAHGVYAGDPEELAVGFAFPRVYALEAEHGSLLRGALAGRRKSRESTPRGPLPLVGYRGGFGALAKDLSRDLDIRYGTEAVRVVRPDEAASDGRFTVIIRASESTGESGTSIDTDRVVSTLPAAVSRTVLGVLGDLDEVRSLPFAAVATVSLVFDRDTVGHPLDGFGFLVPHVERQPILGCLFVSSLFAESAPANRLALTVMVGGRRNPPLVDLDDDAMIDTVLEALRQPLGIAGSPIASLVNRWRPGIPQPTESWPNIQAAADAVEDANPGLTILGSWRSGPGVPNCIAASRRC